MDDDDRTRSRRQAPLDAGRIERGRRRVDVGEHGRRPAAHDRQRRRERSHRRRDDLVAGADAERHQPDLDGVEPVADTDRVVGVDRLGPCVLETADLVAKDPPTRPDHPFGCCQLAADERFAVAGEGVHPHGHGTSQYFAPCRR
jgi:hypothetical protein